MSSLARLIYFVVFIGTTPLWAQQEFAQPVAPRTQGPPQQAPRQPFPPLTPQAQQRIDQLLNAWEASSKQTEQLQCKFTRWEYRPLGASKDVHKTWARGTIKYRAPAEGMYRVDDILFFTGFDEKHAPKYERIKGHLGEWWVCNGKELMEFNRAEKKVEITELPPEMQGKEIVSSPLPFVFNLNAQEMKQRYWIREPKMVEGEFWLEAWPKYQRDRAEFLKVLVILKADQQQFLPKALIMFPPNHDERDNPLRDVYEFTDVLRNGSLLGNIKEFFKDFIDVKPPADFKPIRNRYNPPARVATGQTPASRQ